VDDLIQQGVAAFKAGKRDEARQIFASVIKQNPDDDRAWVGMYNVALNDKEHAYCLKQLLRINPNNKKVRQLYDELVTSTPGKTRPRKITFAMAFFAGIALFCLASILLSFLYVSATSITSTPTTQALLSIEKVIELTSSAASAQTAVSYSPTPFSTEVIPLVTVESIPTSTLYVYLTDTPFVLATPSQVEAQATVPPQSAVCSCSGDTLNCGDFSSTSRAQACYDYCISLGRGDVHRLDRDGDGLACEG
jgi:hypothetical protein